MKYISFPAITKLVSLNSRKLLVAPEPEARATRNPIRTDTTAPSSPSCVSLRSRPVGLSLDGEGHLFARRITWAIAGLAVGCRRRDRLPRYPLAEWMEHLVSHIHVLTIEANLPVPLLDRVLTAIELALDDLGASRVWITPEGQRLRVLANVPRGVGDGHADSCSHEPPRSDCGDST